MKKVLSIILLCAIALTVSAQKASVKKAATSITNDDMVGGISKG